MTNSNFKIEVRYGQKDPVTQDIEWKSKKDHNLINNNGLDMLSDYWATQCTEYVYLETGGGVNARYSGTINISQSGNDLISVDPFFLEADAVNTRLLVWDDGSQAVITNYTDSVTGTALDNKTVSAQPCTIYYVEETLMDGFAVASNTYETFGGANENTWNVAADVLTITNKRTVAFPIEPVDITYKGAGWTPLSAPGSQIFGRKVLDIEITGGTQPIVEVTMSRKVDLTAETITTPIIAGITEDFDIMNLMGSVSYNTVAYWSSIDANGLTVAPTDNSTFMECVTTNAAKVALGEYSGALDQTNINITGDPYSAKSVAQTYTAGNFYSDYIATFTPNDFASSDWNTIALLSNTDDTKAFWRAVFANPQDFSSNLLKGLRIRKSWNRYYD